MHFFWRGSCSAQVLSWCLHSLWGQRLLLRSALQVRCARSPEGRAPRTPRREGQSRVGSTDPSVFLWAQENSLNVPIAPCPYYCRLDKPMRLSRNGLGDNEGEPSCAGSVRGLPTASHRATTLAAGLLQMATWDEMKEYGVDQNTISYNSLLSRWQLASSWQWRTRHSWLRGVTHHRASPHGPVPEHFGAASAPSCCGKQVTHQRPLCLHPCGGGG